MNPIRVMAVHSRMPTETMDSLAVAIGGTFHVQRKDLAKLAEDLANITSNSRVFEASPFVDIDEKGAASVGLIDDRWTYTILYVKDIGNIDGRRIEAYKANANLDGLELQEAVILHWFDASNSKHADADRFVLEDAALAGDWARERYRSADCLQELMRIWDAWTTVRATTRSLYGTLKELGTLKKSDPVIEMKRRFRAVLHDAETAVAGM